LEEIGQDSELKGELKNLINLEPLQKEKEKQTARKKA